MKNNTYIIVLTTLLLLFGKIPSLCAQGDGLLNAISVYGGVTTNSGYLAGADYERYFPRTEMHIFSGGVSFEYINQKNKELDENKSRSQAFLLTPQYKYRYRIMPQWYLGAGIGLSIGFSDTYNNSQGGLLQDRTSGKQFCGGAMLNVFTEYSIHKRWNILLSLREFYNGNATLDNWLLNANIGIRYFF
ncbi:MAG: hypothetical protein ACRDDZ_05440 [Marinifilaceae bacterium]